MAKNDLRTIVGWGWAVSLAVAVIGTGVGLFIYDLYERAQLAEAVFEIESAHPSEWVEIEQARPVSGVDPAMYLAYVVHKTVVARVTSDPRNVETGEVVCAGGTIAVVLEPAGMVTATVTLTALAGLKSCVWPSGRYATLMTWHMIDNATQLQIKPIVMEVGEFIVP